MVENVCRGLLLAFPFSANSLICFALEISWVFVFFEKQWELFCFLQCEVQHKWVHLPNFMGIADGEFAQFPSFATSFGFVAAVKALIALGSMRKAAGSLERFEAGLL